MSAEGILKESRLLRGFSDDHIRLLASVAEEQSFSSGNTVFREGQAGRSMYFLAMGTVQVLKSGGGDEPEEVATLGSGSYFGEMALLLDKHERTGTVVAQETTTLLRVELEALDGLCEEDPTLGYRFYAAIAAGLARRLNHANLDTANLRAYWKAHHH